MRKILLYTTDSIHVHFHSITQGYKSQVSHQIDGNQSVLSEERQIHRSK